MPKPAHMRWSIWRRLRSGVEGNRAGGERDADSVHIEHFVGDQQQLSVLLPTRHLRGVGFAQERERKFGFRLLRLASEKQAIRILDAPRVVFFWISRQPVRQRVRLGNHERAVQHEKFLSGGRAHGPFLGVDIGVGIIQLHQQIVQFEPADARLKRAAMSSSNAGYVGGSPEWPKLLAVGTSSLPKNRPHTRFTMTRDASGLFEAAIASASSRRPLPSLNATGSLSERTRRKRRATTG